MIAMVIGAALTWCAALAAGAAWDAKSIAGIDQSAAGWRFVLIAALTVWLTAELAHLIRPKMVFDRRNPALVRRSIMGVVIGLTGLAMTVVAIPMIPAAIDPGSWTALATSDMVVVGAASIVATLTVLIPCAVQRRGHCYRCGYDLRTLFNAATCPECGVAEPR